MCIYEYSVLMFCIICLFVISYYKYCFNSSFEFSKYNFINLKLFEDCVIDESLSYRDNILEIVKHFFKNDIEKIDIINKRLEYDFFTTSDLIFIINNS